MVPGRFGPKRLGQPDDSADFQSEIPRPNIYFVAPLGTCFCNLLFHSVDLNLNSLLVKRQIDNPSPGAVMTGGN